MQSTPSQQLASAWRLQDAKAQFSELVDNALRGVPQHVTRRGKQAVVVLSEVDFEALQRNASNRSKKPTGLIEHLLAMPKMPVQSKSKKSSIADPVFPSMDLEPREIDFS
jgi:antitoxin Phd